MKMKAQQTTFALEIKRHVSSPTHSKNVHVQADHCSEEMKDVLKKG